MGWVRFLGRAYPVRRVTALGNTEEEAPTENGKRWENKSNNMETEKKQNLPAESTKSNTGSRIR